VNKEFNKADSDKASEESVSAISDISNSDLDNSTLVPIDFSSKQMFLDKLTDENRIGEEIDTASIFHPKESVGSNVYVSSEVVYFGKWRNYENVSARLVEQYDDVVVLECLIDKENGLYEERLFRVSLFEGFRLEIGDLFYLRFFERQNEDRMEIHGKELVAPDDFPKLDYKKAFSGSKLFKQRSGDKGAL
jgi:hypothetical protein